MFPSLLTALCFAMAGISARQSTQRSGPLRANAGRLLVGILILGCIALFSWQGMARVSLIGLGIAGGIGFGMGGFFMMLTLHRLGTPSALLLVESTTAVLAGLLAWIAINDTMTLSQGIACGIILTGVLIAGWNWMRESHPHDLRIRFEGYSFGFLASCFQALSLVISRHVFVNTAQLGDTVSKLDAAWIRLLGGGAIASLFLIAAVVRARKHSLPHPHSPDRFRWLRRNEGIWHQPLTWMTLNGIAGPVLGVTCWLWAVSLMNPGIVQSIAAVAPLISLPIARLLEKEQLGIPFFIGAPVAIAGVALLALS